jgi:hypothetical protein
MQPEVYRQYTYRTLTCTRLSEALQPISKIGIKGA